MPKFASFEEIMARFARGDVRLSRFDLYGLSGPSAAEAALFQQRWPELPFVDRRKVMRILVESAEANFEMDFGALFRYALTDPDDEVRFLAVEGLWEEEDAWLVAPLIRLLLNDPSDDVRAAAAMSLGRYALQVELGDLDEERAQAVARALLAVIDDPEELVEVRRRAVESIAYLDIPALRGIISRAYDEGNLKMRASAVFAMGRSGDAHWRGTVLSELEAVEPEVRFEAARAAGELQLAEAVPTLIQMLGEADQELQEAAIWALGQVGGAQARQALEDLVSGENEALVDAAEEALGELLLGVSPLLMFSYDGEDDAELDEEELEEDEDAADWATLGLIDASDLFGDESDEDDYNLDDENDSEDEEDEADY